MPTIAESMVPEAIRGNCVAPGHRVACVKTSNPHSDSKLQNSLADHLLPIKKSLVRGVTNFFSTGSGTIVNPGLVNPSRMWGRA